MQTWVKYLIVILAIYALVHIIWGMYVFHVNHKLSTGMFDSIMTRDKAHHSMKLGAVLEITISILLVVGLIYWLRQTPSSQDYSVY